jgi:hypothetical protein
MPADCTSTCYTRVQSTTPQTCHACSYIFFVHASVLTLARAHSLMVHARCRYVLIQLEQLAATQYLQQGLSGALAVWDFSAVGAAFLTQQLRHPHTAIVTVPVPYDHERGAPPVDKPDPTADHFNEQVGCASDCVFCKMWQLMRRQGG